MMNPAAAARRARRQTKEDRMREAAKAKDVQLMARLIGQGARINDEDAYGNTALMISSDYGAEDVVEELLGRKAKVNVKDKLGQTALSYACFSGHYNIVKRLLEHKAGANVATNEGQAALHRACYTRHQHTINVVMALMEHGAKIDVQRQDGRTPLMLSAISNSADVVKYLLQSKGAKPNLQDNEGNTAVLLAAKHSNFAILTLLVRYGADPRVANKAGESVAKMTTFNSIVGTTVEALQEEVAKAIKQGLLDKATDQMAAEEEKQE